MYWYKRMVHPDYEDYMTQAIDEFGPSAYLLYNASCKLYANQFDKVVTKLLTTCGQSVDNLLISCVYVELSLVGYENETRTKRKQTNRQLEFFRKKKLIYYEINKKIIKLFIPEVLENADEYTKKQFKKNSLSYPDIIRTLSAQYPE